MAKRKTIFLKMVIVFFVFCMVIATIAFQLFVASLPKIIKPEQYKPMVVSEVYAEGGEKIGEFFEIQRKLIPLDEIPKVVINAFIAAEDAQFFSHKGIDFQSIVRAAIKNFRAKKFVQGGSTITQQVAKSLLLTPERKLSRKFKEVFLAMNLEKNLSKKDILYLYLNEIYLGHGAYGVEAAAQNYFGKHASELDLAEAAILAGLPQAPSRYSPLINPNAAKERQLYVLKQMVDNGYISKLEATEARDQVLHFLEKYDFNLHYAPYFVEHIRRYLVDKYGNDKVLKEGFQIHTTLNLEFQKSANLALEKGLRQLDKRQGYRGANKKLSKNEIELFLEQQSLKEIFEEGKVVQAIVSKVDDNQKKILVHFGSHEGEISFPEMRWARKPDVDKYYLEDLLKNPSQALSPGDLIWIRIMESPTEKKITRVALEQDPLVQGALLSYDFKTGFVKSMIGGFDYSKSEFNRAFQAKRQAGSTFKPIIYLAALENGYTPSSVIIDSPIIYQSEEEAIEEKWKPRNFGERFFGDTLLANALIYSRNVVTIKIVQDIKIPTVIEYARKLGIESPLIEDLSMALGSSSVTLEEMCRVFAIFANEGKKSPLVFIKKIVDRDGNILEEYSPSKEQENILPPEKAYIMTHLLKGVAQVGTGKSVGELNWPLAGKTGTTSDYADAWFVGYSPDILTGVWVGFDERQKLGEHETGSLAAIPIWKSYMAEVLKTYPKKDFSVPDKVVFVNVDAKTGKLANRKTKQQVSLAFVEGTEPSISAESSQSQKSLPQRNQPEEEEFFKEELE